MALRLRSKVILIYCLLGVLTIVSYAMLGILSTAYPLLFGIGVLSYLLGLRHGVDADHILAIDNATRKMMHDGKKPIANGLFFSLGHSTIVVIMVIVVVLVSESVFNYVQGASGLFNIIGTLVSASFLCIIAVMNLIILIGAYRAYKGSKGKGDNAAAVRPTGLMNRLYSRLFKSIHSSWQLYPIGVLFGLGFDTATEVLLIGTSAAAAGSGIPLLYILILPAMFAAGMTLVDTTDSIFMVRAYDWALADRSRSLLYNVVVTGASVITAFAISGIELAQLLPNAPSYITNISINTIGFGIIAMFVVLLVILFLFRKIRRQHKRG